MALPGPSGRPQLASRRKAAARRAAVKSEGDLYALGSQTVRQIRDDLEAARKATAAALSTLPAGWRATQAKAVLDEIERSMRLWEQAATSRMGPSLDAAYANGHLVAPAALIAGGIDVVAAPAVSTAYVAAAYQTSALLIKDVSNDVIRDVDRAIRRGSLAQATPMDLMQQLGSVVGPTKRGPFRNATLRAEAIVRTEMGRVASVANDASMRELARTQPGLGKEWLAVLDGRVRDAHARAHGQVRAVDKPFDVGGEALQYPRDPRGSGRNTIQCRCVSAPTHPDWDDPALAEPDPFVDPTAPPQPANLAPALPGVADPASGPALAAAIRQGMARSKIARLTQAGQPIPPALQAIANGTAPAPAAPPPAPAPVAVAPAGTAGALALPPLPANANFKQRRAYAAAQRSLAAGLPLSPSQMQQLGKIGITPAPTAPVGLGPLPATANFKQRRAYAAAQNNLAKGLPLTPSQVQQLSKLGLSLPTGAPAAPVAPVAPVAAPRATRTATIAAEEARIDQLRDHEEIVVIDAAGKVVARKPGDQYSVGVDDAELLAWRGMTLTHNHPRGWEYDESDARHVGNSFSRDDVNLGIQGQLAEVRAIARGHVYSLRPGSATWDDGYLDRAPVGGGLTPRETMQRHEAEVRAEFMREINSWDSKWPGSPGDQTRIALAESMHWHEVWTRVSKDLGWDYSRIDRKALASVAKTTGLPSFAPDFAKPYRGGDRFQGISPTIIARIERERVAAAKAAEKARIAAEKAAEKARLELLKHPTKNPAKASTTTTRAQGDAVQLAREQLRARKYQVPSSYGSSGPKARKGDEFLTDLAARRGYGGLPHVVSRRELDQYAKTEIELFRAVNNPDHHDKWRTDELKHMLGIYGNGTYAAGTLYPRDNGYVGRKTALQAARGYGPTVMRMTIKADAKLIAHSDLQTEMQNYIRDENQAARDRRYAVQGAAANVARAQRPDLFDYNGQPGALNTKMSVERLRTTSEPELQQLRQTIIDADKAEAQELEAVREITRNEGRFAVARGYDVIDVGGSYATGNASSRWGREGYFVVLNRTAVRVQSVDVNQEPGQMDEIAFGTGRL